MTTAIHSFLSLYERDGRRGDSLLELQRQLSHSWTVVTRPSTANPFPIYEMLDTIGKICELCKIIILAIPAVVLGLIGVTIKALSPMPPTPPPPWPRDPLFYNPNELEPNIEERIMPYTEPCCFTEEKLGLDIIVHTLTFVTDKEKLRMMQISYLFKKAALKDILWEPALERNGILGPAINLYPAWVQDQGNLSESRGPRSSPSLEQLKAYHLLQKRHFSPRFDYFARFLRGGPVAFSKFPLYTSLNAIDRSQSVMRNNSSIAIRIRDKTTRKESILTCSERGDVLVWNHVLRVVNGTLDPEDVPPGYNGNIELA